VLQQNCEIQFCLALEDPIGNPLSEPGIDRVRRQDKGFSSPAWSINYIENVIKPNTFWDPNRYFNIWVVDISGGYLGYAQFPNNSTLGCLNNNNGGASTDGVVLLYQSVGRPPANPYPPPYNLGRTATHEVGHWLGLRHIWGDSNCGNDCCGDTPTALTANFGCPYPQTTCSSVDMVQNYMDYTDDNCMNLFTVNQKNRMRTVMQVSPRRVDLLSSTVCGSGPPPTSDFYDWSHKHL